MGLLRLDVWIMILHVVVAHAWLLRPFTLLTCLLSTQSFVGLIDDAVIIVHPEISIRKSVDFVCL